MTKQQFLKNTTIIFLCVLSNQVLAQGFALFPKGEKPNGFVFFMLVVSGILLALAVHELGHLLTGLAQGFRFQLFVVGPLGIRRDNNKIKVYLNKNIGMMGGIAATVPVIAQEDNKKKFARLILAGPMASLIFGLLAIAIAPFGSILWSWFFFLTGACSLGLVAATTLPKKSGVYFTDRARYQRLTGKGKAAESELALLNIIAQSMTDNHHKNISVEKALLLQQDDEPLMKFWGYYYAHQFYKENGLREQTESSLAILLSNKKLVSKEIWKVLKIESE
jgi:hypothetical protein